MHGFFYSDLASHDKDHHCEICESISHISSITPTKFDFDFSYQEISTKLLPIFNEWFVSFLENIDSNGTRAPPIS